MRRILILIAVLLIIGALGFGAYLLFGDRTIAPVIESEPNFGTGGDYVPGGEGTEPLGEVDSEAGEVLAPKLVKIADGPVAFGSVAFPVIELIPSASTTATGEPLMMERVDTEVRYLERGSGNAYAYRNGARTLTRISNRTLPGVYEASWLSNGSLTYARFLSADGAIETYALPIGEDAPSGYFLEQGLSEVAVRGTTTLATLLPSSSGSIATVAGIGGESFRTLFSSPLASLRLQFFGSNFLAYTRGAASMSGYLFSVHGTNGSFERLLGPLRGLSGLGSPTGRYVLYSYLSGTNLRTELFDTTTRESIPVPLGTLSEKCIFAADETAAYCAVPRALSGTLPDDWYQGAVSFSDRLWRIDLSGRVAVLLADPESAAGVRIDAGSLAVDARGDVLVFTNRTDGSLYVYDL